MAQEMSPKLYAAHAGIPPTTVEDWVQGRGAVLIDPRDIREIHGKLKVIAVAPPNEAGKGARPRFIPNPAYKYVRKGKKSVHEAGGTGSVEVVPVQGSGVAGMPKPGAQNIQGNPSLGMIGREGMAQGLQVSNWEASASHA